MTVARGRRQHRAGVVGRGGGAVESGQAEIEHLHEAVGADHQVLGLHVAMDEPSLVRRGQCRGRLDGEVEDVGKRDWTGSQPLPERDTLDEFGGNEVQVAIEAEFVDHENVRMTERRRRARFALEALEAVAIVLVKNLECDRAGELAVAGEVDLPHASGAEPANDLVATDARAGRECHRVRKAPAPPPRRQR